MEVEDSTLLEVKTIRQKRCFERASDRFELVHQPFKFKVRVWFTIIMSLTQAVRVELSSIVQAYTPSEPTASSQPPTLQDGGPTEVEPPIGQQRVFEVAPLISMGTSHKIAIAVFIVTSNLVQVKRTPIDPQGRFICIFTHTV